MSPLWIPSFLPILTDWTYSSFLLAGVIKTASKPLSAAHHHYLCLASTEVRLILLKCSRDWLYYSPSQRCSKTPLPFPIHFLSWYSRYSKIWSPTFTFKFIWHHCSPLIPILSIEFYLMTGMTSFFLTFQPMFIWPNPFSFKNDSHFLSLSQLLPPIRSNQFLVKLPSLIFLYYLCPWILNCIFPFEVIPPEKIVLD